MHAIPGMRRTAAQRGFFFIGLLIVLLIIGILSYQQMGPGGSEATAKIDRTKDVACQANRAVFSASVMSWRMGHQGETCTIDNIRKSGTAVPGCPGGGVWSVSPDGAELYCSLHHPAPADVATEARTTARAVLGMPATPAAQPTPNLNE